MADVVVLAVLYFIGAPSGLLGTLLAAAAIALIVGSTFRIRRQYIERRQTATEPPDVSP
jgi:hypothetical protein